MTRQEYIKGKLINNQNRLPKLLAELESLQGHRNIYKRQLNLIKQTKQKIEDLKRGILTPASEYFFEIAKDRDYNLKFIGY